MAQAYTLLSADTEILVFAQITPKNKQKQFHQSEGSGAKGQKMNIQIEFVLRPLVVLECCYVWSGRIVTRQNRQQTHT